MCDIGYKVIFDKKVCSILDSSSNVVIFTGTRKNNVYKINISHESKLKDTCLVASNDEHWLWHRRLGHASISQSSNLSKGDFVIGLPKIEFKKDKLCNACQFGKQFK